MSFGVRKGSRFSIGGKLFPFANNRCHLGEASAQFVDVPTEHWAAQAIEAVRSAGLMTGDENGLFHPNDPITFGFRLFRSRLGA
ncbi:S-layer homology domain-containing protein [Brevibacillus parabrevis]|uniref:S-layer homology domain-containing protein n=1 Tax=Brevibacillus parabrevis TaxID=54914 RepID=UPI00399C95D5